MAEKRTKNLICACCGEHTKGCQWWNRDIGYGLCGKCFNWLKSRGETLEEITKSYGKEGYNFFNTKDLGGKNDTISE